VPSGRTVRARWSFADVPRVMQSLRGGSELLHASTRSRACTLASWCALRTTSNTRFAVHVRRSGDSRYASGRMRDSGCAGADDSRRRALAGIEPARDIEVRMMSKVNTTRASMAPAPGTQSWRNAGKPAAARIRLVPRPAPCARYASGHRVILWTSAGAVIRRSCIGHAWRRA
jgi:hypothetical protein